MRALVFDEWIKPITNQLSYKLANLNYQEGNFNQILVIQKKKMVSIGEFLSNLSNDESVSVELREQLGIQAEKYFKGEREKKPSLCWQPINPNKRDPKLELKVV